MKIYNSRDIDNLKIEAKKLCVYLYYNIYPDIEINNLINKKNILKEFNYLLHFRNNHIKLYYKFLKKILYKDNSNTFTDKWQITFVNLINSLSYERYKNLLFFLPKELLNKNLSELKTFKGITAFELAAISCEHYKSLSIPNNKKITINHEKFSDCWYNSDSPEAKCCHLQRNEICPVMIPPSLSHDGIILKPNKIKIDVEILKLNHRTIIENINKPFKADIFSNEPSLPISIGILDNKKAFSKWHLISQPQNLPIKMPFTDYKIPNEIIQFKEFIQRTADYWHSINDSYADYYYCYFSVAQSKVPPGCFQRRGHLHSDGFQSTWLKTELFSDFTFIASDTASTEFYLQSFDVSDLSPNRDNYYKYFNNNLKVKPIRLRKPYEIIAMDTYTLHKSIRNESSKIISRTFVRIMYSVIRWFSQHNAHNPMFDYEWPKMNRTLLSKLK